MMYNYLFFLLKIIFSGLPLKSLKFVNPKKIKSLNVLEFILNKFSGKKNPYYSLRSTNVLFRQHFLAYAY